jgi:hypothetical protein
MGFKFRNEPKIEHFVLNSVKKNRISYILAKGKLIYRNYYVQFIDQLNNVNSDMNFD